MFTSLPDELADATYIYSRQKTMDQVLSRAGHLINLTQGVTTVNELRPAWSAFEKIPSIFGVMASKWGMVLNALDLLPWSKACHPSSKTLMSTDPVAIDLRNWTAYVIVLDQYVYLQQGGQILVCNLNCLFLRNWGNSPQFPFRGKRASRDQEVV